MSVTSNRARHAPIPFSCLLLLKCGYSAHADNRGPCQTVPDFSGDGDAPPRVPVPDLSGIGDSPPSPTPRPDLPGTGTLPRPRFRVPSGGSAPPGRPAAGALLGSQCSASMKARRAPSVPRTVTRHSPTEITTLGVTRTRFLLSGRFLFAANRHMHQPARPALRLPRSF